MSGPLAAGPEVDGPESYGPVVNLMGGGNPSSGPTPAYSLNFLSGSLDGSLTFTRASTATYYNSSGIIASAANNNARFDYNPSNLTLNGLLIEGAATNRCFPSIPDNSNWTNNNTTQTLNAVTSPDGTTNATALNDTVATAQPFFIQENINTFSFANTTYYAFSIYAKKNTQTAIQIVAPSAAFGTTAFANFDLNAGTVGYISGCTALIQSCPNGWYRCTMVAITTAAATTSTFAVALTNSTPSTTTRIPTYNGVGTGVYLWGAQLETSGIGASASSYIPTTSAVVTRATEAVYNSSIGVWYNASAGTLFFEYLTQQLTPSGFMASLNAGSNSNYIGSYWSAAPNAKGVIEVSGTEYDSGTINVTGNTVTKTGLAYTAGNNNFAINGTLASNGTAGTSAIPSGLNQLSLGGNVAATGFWLRSFAYYNTRLTNTQLQTISGTL